MKDKPTGGDQINWHALEPKEIFKKLSSAPTGLSSKEAADRQREFGLNTLPSRKVPSLMMIFLSQFLSPLIYILILAGGLSLFLREWEDAGFIFAVILLNSIVGAWQENKAEKNAAALQKLLKIRCLVRRDGAEKELSSEELVPGDIVFLETGSKVPADIRLFESRNLSVDESFLTGESKAVEKIINKLKKETSLNNRVNLLFAGSTIFTGRAWGIVLETGLNTEVGKIANIITETDKAKPPLIIRMEKFTKNIALIILVLCIGVALIASGKGMAVSEAFFLVVALAVSAIPSGLPVALTVALSVATTRMSKRNVIVRKLTAVEGLGSCTMIASDKTGTLTVNQQAAKLIYLPSGMKLEISGQGYNGDGEIKGLRNLKDGDAENLHRALESMVLANEAKLVRQGKKWTHHGDAIDIAFLALAYKAGLNPEKVEDGAEKLFEVPYESERRYAGSIYQRKKKTYFAVKGSVDRILDFCDRAKIGSKNAPLDTNKIRQAGIALASQGYRVLAVARGEYKGEVPNDLNSFNDNKIKDLKFLALVCFIDPLRPESRDSILKCQQAGIGVKMITGDHPATALFIAKELGMAATEKEVVVGEKMDNDKEITPEFLALVEKTKVFAGVSPLQKLKIVAALVKLGHFVAVTGDGVNDAPAMKQANIGVAMGSGTDVAKETSTMIVADDNFSSLVNGIEEGRSAYSNIRKVIYFTISSGAAEISIFLFALLALSFLPLDTLIIPLTAVQLLWLNVVTNGIQDIGLAFEGREPGEMNKPPRPPKEGIFNRLMTQQTIISGLIMGVITFGVWFFLVRAGYSTQYASNYIMMLLVLFQSVHAFNARSETTSTFKIPLKKNLFLVIGVLAAQGLHIAATYNPFMQKTLQIQPISLKDWLSLLFLASLILWGMELFKLIKRKRLKATV